MIFSSITHKQRLQIVAPRIHVQQTVTFLVQGFQRQQQLIQEEENAKSLSLQKKKKKKARETRKKIEAIEAAERAQFEAAQEALSGRSLIDADPKAEAERVTEAARLETERKAEAEAARLETETETEKAELTKADWVLRVAEAQQEWAAAQPGARVVDGRIVVPHFETEKESSIGGISTCIVCFTHDKTHLAFPCGHQCVCEECSKAMHRCPYCREDVVGWTQVRMA